MSEHVVVVGAGAISGSWFGPLAAENVHVDAVVDLDVARARARIEEFHLDAQASTDMGRMLRKHRPDFVLDLTVPDAHCSVTCRALKMGCHVLGEKPLAASMAQARRMLAASEKSGRCYMVNQSRRWDKNHHAARRMVASGAIGPLTAMNCDFYIGAHFGGFRDEMPSPLILDMAIHHFDLARYISGADAVSVYAHEFNPAGSWYKGSAASSCIFEMSGGIVFTYSGSWCAEGCHTGWNGNWRLVGTSGTVLMENDSPPRGQALAGETGFHRPMRDITPPPQELVHESMRGALREMLEFLRAGRKPQTECHDNIRSLAMVFGALESSRKRRRVEIRHFPGLGTRA